MDDDLTAIRSRFSVANMFQADNQARHLSGGVAASMHGGHETALRDRGAV
jgi:hypothetical protein